MSGVERIARWIVAALVVGVMPLVAWSGGCSSNKAQPDAATGGSAGAGAGGGTTGAAGLGGTTGLGGKGGCSAYQVSSCDGRGGASGQAGSSTGGQTGGSGGAGGVGGAPGQGGSGGAGGIGGGSGQGGSIDGGIQCCSGAPSQNPARCSQDGQHIMLCQSNAACVSAPGGYSLMMVLQDCPGGCVMADGSTQVTCRAGTGGGGD